MVTHAAKLERGCVEDQPQQWIRGGSATIIERCQNTRLLRLVFDTAALVVGVNLTTTFNRQTRMPFLFFASKIMDLPKEFSNMANSRLQSLLPSFEIATANVCGAAALLAGVHTPKVLAQAGKIIRKIRKNYAPIGQPLPKFQPQTSSLPRNGGTSFCSVILRSERWLAAALVSDTASVAC